MDTTLVLDYEHDAARSATVVRALLTIRGEAPNVVDRPPLNLSLVLDRSGSMAGEPLEAAKGAAGSLVRRLQAKDAVSVVAYDDAVRTVAEPTRGEGHAAVARDIAHIRDGGSTNLSGGWLRGRELVAQAMVDGTNRIVLLTDGHANAGITDRGMLAALCAEARTKGITTTTIGFGPGFDEHLLRAMADAGGGNTYYIEQADQARDVFGEEIAGLSSLAAQNVAVVLACGAQVELVRVHHDYPTVAANGAVRVELGDLYAHEPRTLLVELFLLGSPSDATRAIATLTVHAHVLLPNGGLENREIVLPIAATLDGTTREAPEVKRELLLLAAARAREAALRARETGDYSAGATALGSVADALSAAPDLDPELASELDDLRLMRASFVAEEVTAADAKYLAQMAYATHRGKRDMKRNLGRTR